MESGSQWGRWRLCGTSTSPYSDRAVSRLKVLLRRGAQTQIQRVSIDWLQDWRGTFAIPVRHERRTDRSLQPVIEAPWALKFRSDAFWVMQSALSPRDTTSGHTASEFDLPGPRKLNRHGTPQPQPLAQNVKSRGGDSDDVLADKPMQR